MSGDADSRKYPPLPPPEVEETPTDPGRLRKRSVVIAGHRTSVSLEDAFWAALTRIARARKESLGSLVTRIDRERSGNLSSAIRVFVLAEFEARAVPTEPTPRGCGAHRG